MKFSDIVMIMAVLAAPVLAVQVQKWLEMHREKRGRKLWIFKTLMATRASTVANEHVQALNMIDLEFTEKKFKLVTDAWKKYLDCLGDYPKDDQTMVAVWVDRRANLLTVLLKEMGQSLGYKFDEVHIKKGIYSPEAHGKNETENRLIREGLVRLFYGDGTIKMDIQNLPIDDQVLVEQKIIRDLLLKILEGERPVLVCLDKRTE